MNKRLIEDMLPIAAINEVAQREKIGHAATHPRKLHLWWARRPLAAARAAVYAAVVPAGGRNKTDEEEFAFFTALCRWGGPQWAIDQARAEVLAANGGVPPKIVDLFAGGGAIPLEAARLGGEATAVELNPVAHLIQKCMLDYPQRFPGLADDVREWGQRWVDRAWEQLADLYPSVEAGSGQGRLGESAEDEGRRPLAYLWTRTVLCPNPALAPHRAPLLRQTWLARKKNRYVALKPMVDRQEMIVRYEVVESNSEQGLGFDPALGSRRGQTACLICGATITADYVKAEGQAGRLDVAPLCAVVLKASNRGRDYLSVDMYALPDDEDYRDRLDKLDVQPPDEPIPADDVRNFWTPLYGLTRFRDLFTPRQLLTLCTLAAGVREVHADMLVAGIESDQADAVATFLALILSRAADYMTSLCTWHVTGEKTNHTYARQALPLVWDFSEVNPFAGASGDLRRNVRETADILAELQSLPRPATVVRASAVSLPLVDESQDAVVTDPPYYDNISYADLSDFFYVWLKRSVGFLHPDHFGGELTPKRGEAVVAPYRHGGNRQAARGFYEDLMAQTFAEAHRVLKPGAPLVCIYAHKTTLGWATLVEALRTAGFTITEAWPLDTEMPQRSVGQGTASLASSIFLVARKRDPDAGTGSESAVMAELDGIIAERLGRLEKAGVTGSDLVIATAGAGLKPFTRFARVEQDNGEALPAERFLTLVQNRVLDAVFGGLAGADPQTRFYVAAQFSYGYGFVPFDEANQLARMTGVELDGTGGLTSGGTAALLDKQKGKVKLRDFEARGEDDHLGLPEEAQPKPVIDVAHGLIWRAEYRSGEIAGYLDAAKPDAHMLRMVVQALAGKALRTGSGDAKAAEAAAAERLLGAWRRLVETHLSDGRLAYPGEAQ